MQTKSRRTAVGIMLGVIAGMWGFAALCTLAAPCYVVSLDRQPDGRVDAAVSQRILWAFPWRTRTLQSIRAVQSGIDRAEPTTNPNSDRADRPFLVPDNVGVLRLQGTAGELEILVAPQQVDAASRDVRDFLAGDASQIRRMFVSHWTAAVVVPAILAALGGLFLIGIAWDALAAPFRWLARR